MYTVSKGPSKFVAKTRRGVSQNLERFENFRENSKKPTDVECNENTVSIPKPVFHTSKRAAQIQREPYVISPQHEEIIRFVREYGQSIVYYDDGERSHVLQDFKPFDLESWWGKRIYNSITKST